MPPVGVDAEELSALRTLARRALELSGMIDRRELVAPRTKRPFDPSDELEWQELNLVRRLVGARGGVVPADSLVEHLRNDRRARTAEMARAPTTQVCRARAKCRHLFGRECIETVWPTRVNARGRVVRAQELGILGYRWTGPDIAGMAVEAARELGLTAGDGDPTTGDDR